MADNKNVYEIGLAMAGAISAGAYSAGVVDFLFQALHEWELAKRDDPGKMPNHSVCIRAAAGASAGSITAALAAVAVAGGLRPQKVADVKDGEQPYQCVVPALYKAWVTLPDMASPKPNPNDLLANNDLRDGLRRNRSSMQGSLPPSPGKRSACRSRPREASFLRHSAAPRCLIWPSACTSISRSRTCVACPISSASRAVGRFAAIT